MNTFLLIWFLSGFVSYIFLCIRYKVGVWGSLNLNYLAVFLMLGIISIVFILFLLATDRH